MMMFSRKQIVILGTAAAIGAAIIHHALKPSHSFPPQAVSQKSKAAKPPPDFSRVAERIQALAYRQPTPEELEEEKQYNREQASALAKDMDDPNPEKRLEAVEQLGAYPSTEAEDLLTLALVQDGDVRVREMAARTLDTLDEPSTHAIDALLQAIEDNAVEVQQASLLTLERWLTDEADKARPARIVRGLKQAAHSNRLAEETKEYLQDLLEQSETNAEGTSGSSAPAGS
jgi:HEAT repeat protein